MQKKCSDEEIRDIIKKSNQNPTIYKSSEIDKVIKDIESKVNIKKLVKEEEREKKAEAFKQQKNTWPVSVRIDGKNYYTVEDLTEHYNVSKESVKSLIKEGIIKSINIGNQYMLIPQEKFFKKNKDYLDWIFRNNTKAIGNKKNVNLSDKIRVNLASFWIYLFFPGLSLLIFIKIVGADYLLTGAGQLFALMIIVIVGIITTLLYKYLFPKYSDDLPD